MFLANEGDKIITEGIEVKVNTKISLIEQLISFITTIQGTTETNYEYLNRFNARLQNLILAVEFTFCACRNLYGLIKT